MSDEEKSNEPTSEQIQETLQRLDAVTRHIENVRENCILVGRRLIEDGELDFGRQLIANGHIHDNSKFHGIEWERLHEDVPKAKREPAIANHNSQNPHHPEYWQGIENMPRIYLLEMICDWSARAKEFGTSLREWVEDGAAKRYGYKKGDKTYKVLMQAVDLLCDKPFKQKQ